MGTISIWDWLFTLALLLIPVVLIGYARGRLSRAGFTLRFASAFIALPLAGAIAEDAPLAAFLVIVLILLIYRWTALRLNDVGWNRWLALLWYLWPAGLVMALVLCFKRTANEEIAPVFD